MSRGFRLTVLTSNNVARSIATMGSRTEQPDALDAQLEVWAREIPNLDPLTEGIVERIQILAKSFDRSMDETLAESGLDRRAFKVLGKLRNVGPPYRRSAGQLASHMRLSSGAMTNRLDRMEAAGLIRRLAIPMTGGGRWSSQRTRATRSGIGRSAPRPFARRRSPRS